MTDNKRTERERVARAICDTSGDDWHREGPEGLMDAYGPLADAAIAALRPTDSGLVELDADLHWPAGKQFTFHDDGGHQPCYVVMPDGTAIPLNHWDNETTDIARAKWIIDACNAKLTALRAQGQEERAEIVAFVRANFDAPHVAEVAKRIADAIEAGQHKEAGRG